MAAYSSVPATGMYGYSGEGYNAPPPPPPAEENYFPEHRTRLPITWDNVGPQQALQQSPGGEARRSQALPAAPPPAGAHGKFPPAPQMPGHGAQPRLSAPSPAGGHRRSTPPPPPPADNAFSTRLPGQH
eukprot:gb/GFBE01061433.1/.p2 GENE.gb/GFBE01061433.1/~~gb/GFBE01061433.1/.p2  ORF type:complete len:129 (+),score=13.20 gb/GFBE01061433.1/:3-389(+)